MTNEYKYYEPTEHEAQLIAAGIVTIESVDESYQAYLSSNGPIWTDGPADYEDWQAMRNEWNALNARYEAEIETHWPDKMTPELETLQRYLLDRMTGLEAALGC